MNIIYYDNDSNELFTIITDIISITNNSRDEILRFVSSTEKQYFEYMKSTGKVTSIEDMNELCSNTYIFYTIENTNEYDIRCNTGYFLGCEEIFIIPKKESRYNREIKIFTDSLEIFDNDNAIKDIYYNKKNLL